RRDHLELRRLGDDGRVRLETVSREVTRSFSRHLLVDDRGIADAKGVLPPVGARREEPDEHRREPGLHVAGAASIDAAVAELATGRVLRPSLAQWHRIGVPREQEVYVIGPSGMGDDVQSTLLY